MDHIIIREECLSKDPEVILVWQPIKHANLFCTLNFGVDKHIVAIEGDPIVLNHDLYVVRTRAATRIEHAITLCVLNSRKHQLKEAGLDA